MIDTHTHLYEPEFADDRPQVIERAREAGVEKILLPNINLASVPSMLALCSRYPGYCYPMMGLHPEDVKGDYVTVLEQMHSLLLEPANPYVGVGEVGLDFYWDETFRSEQIDAFAQQIEWALELDLPLMIHTRNAHREMVDVMNHFRARQPKGVFHCFGGTLDEARELLSFEGFALGIGGILTYKKSTLPEVVSALPIDRLVLETDSPYLSPVPYRGKRNESSHLPFILQCLAQAKELSPQQVSEATNATAYRIFSKVTSRDICEMPQ